MREITLTLTSAEAHMILDPLIHGALDDGAKAAKAKDDGEREWHEIRAGVRQRIATAIVDALIEEPTRLDRIGREEFAAEMEFGLV